nr:PAS-domain containing protein [Hydrogenophaga crassostreae]
MVQSIIDHLPSGVSMFDSDMQMVVCNRRLRTLLEFPDSLFEPTLPSLFDLALFNACRGEYGQGNPESLAQEVCVRARSMQPHVIERQRPNGVVIEVRGVPLPTGGFVSIYSDITDRKHAEQEAKRFAAYLDAVINALPQGVTVIDENLVIQLWNKSFEQLLDLPPGLMKPGVTFEEVARSNAERGEYGDVDIEAKVRESADLARRFLPHRIMRQRPNGMTLEVEGSALMGGGDSRGFVTTYTDITQLREAQDALEQLNTELDQRVKDRTRQLRALNTDLESFTYSVSHDLRTPLRSIHGFATVLAESEADRMSEGGRDALHRIQNNAGRMGKLITDLLSMAQQSRVELNMQPVDLSAMARSVVVDLQRGDSARQVEWRIEEGLSTQGDPSLMLIVMQNLLGNAWKYTGHCEAPCIEFFRVSEGDGMDGFCVRDNGAGFDMAYVEQLFQPFKRLHMPNEFEGTGIGLAIVHRILLRHHGSIRGNGSVGKGATFHFSLPWIQGSPSVL